MACPLGKINLSNCVIPFYSWMASVVEDHSVKTWHLPSITWGTKMFKITLNKNLSIYWLIVLWLFNSCFVMHNFLESVLTLLSIVSTSRDIFPSSNRKTEGCKAVWDCLVRINPWVARNRFARCNKLYLGYHGASKGVLDPFGIQKLYHFWINQRKKWNSTLYRCNAKFQHKKKKLLFLKLHLSRQESEPYAYLHFVDITFFFYFSQLKYWNGLKMFSDFFYFIWKREWLKSKLALVFYQLSSPWFSVWLDSY